MSEHATRKSPASSYAALIGGVYLVYGILSLLLTGSSIGDATGNDLWIFTVSPITGILALGTALVAIPAATRPAFAQRLALVAGIGFTVWGLACVASGDSGDPAFAGTTPNVALYLSTGVLGIAASFMPEWLVGGAAGADAGTPPGDEQLDK